MFKQSKEGAIVMIGPLVLLAVGSICIGYLAKELVLANVLVPFVPVDIQKLPLWLGVTGGIAGYTVHASVAGSPPHFPREKLAIVGGYVFFVCAWAGDLVVSS